MSAPEVGSKNTQGKKMPLVDISALTGISVPALSQYGSGVKAPSAETSTRIAIAQSAGSNSVILAHGLSSFPVMGAYIKTHHQSDPSGCISVLANGIQQAKSHLVLAEDIEAFHNKPVHIADDGWNLLLSAAASISWQNFHQGLPWWVFLSPLPAPWSPIDHGKYASVVWKSTPIALRELNLVVGNGLTEAV